MNILALDCTAVAASAAVARDGHTLAVFSADNALTHSELLLPMAESVLHASRMKIEDVDLFACTVGPGSFTGVRIGVATLKGLAFGTGKPCAAVSTLEALAENLVPLSGILCPVMDARRGQFYTAKFAFKDGEITRVEDDSAKSFEELKAEIEALGTRVYLCGDGYTPARKLLGDELSFETPEKLRYQSAYSVAQIAYEKYLAGNRTSAEELRPTYLRLPQAERDRLNKEQMKG